MYVSYDISQGPRWFQPYPTTSSTRNILPYRDSDATHKGTIFGHHVVFETLMAYSRNGIPSNIVPSLTPSWLHC